MSGDKDANLTIFIDSISSSKSVTSFAYYIFLFRSIPDWRLVFDATERNGKLGRIQCRRNKESSSTRKKEGSIPLQKDSESQSERQSRLNELSENCRKGAVRWGKKTEKRLTVSRLGLEATLRCEGKGRRSNGDVKKGATATGLMEKGKSVKVIEGKKVQKDDPLEYFLPKYF